MHLGPNIYAEFLSLLCALFCLGRLRNSFMKWFVPFLALTVLVEIVCHILLQHDKNTLPAYIIFDTITVTFYTFIFYNFSIKKYLKNILLVTISFRIVFTVTYYLLSLIFPSYYLFVVSGIQMIFFSCLLFYQYLRTEDLDIVANHKSGIWFAAGILIFYAGVTIVLSLVNYIRHNELKIAGVYLYNFVPRYLSIILYVCISISLILWKKIIQK